MAENHPQRGRRSRAHVLCAFIAAKRRPFKDAGGRRCRRFMEGICVSIPISFALC